MSINTKKVANYCGEDVFLYTLDNGLGLKAEIYNYGGIIRSLYVNGRDVVLGREVFEDYLSNDGYLGAAIGRFGNRIKNSEFTINGKTYKLGVNDGVNCLHGGISGFDKKVWKAEIKDSAEPSLVLKLNSPDGDEGFPGNLDLTMTYTLTKNNSLKICYEAICDKDTVFSPTNHSYFNLDGAGSGTVYEQTLQLNSDFYTPNTDECLPYGAVLPVNDTPFDFRAEKKIGKDIFAKCEQISMFGGYDHNFVIRGTGFRKFGEMTSSDKKIKMEIFSNLPGVQLYSGNVLSEGSYKNGACYGKHNSVCLETQHFPASPLYSHFPSPILKAEEKFTSFTEYKFITK